MTSNNNTDPGDEISQQLWEAVRSSKTFDAWTALLTHLEAGGPSPALDAALAEFLSNYPLCYGFWKKYADMKMAREGDQAARAIYESALTAFPHSVDLWSCYLAHVAAVSSSDATTLRVLYNRSTKAAGLDWAAFPLWDGYIRFEMSQGQWASTVAVFDQALTVPLDPRFASTLLPTFIEFAGQHTLAELVPDAESLAQLQSASTLKESATEDQLKQIFLNIRQSKSNSTAETVRRRQPFESKIMRPYFHVEPLGADQLDNWRQYLANEDRQIGAGATQESLDRLFFLYERCLVTCAFYEEFWLAYAHRLHAHGRVTEAERAVYRGYSVHLRQSVSLMVTHAHFREEAGDNEGAKGIFTLAKSTLPNHCETLLREAYFLRRSLYKSLSHNQANGSDSSQSVNAHMVTSATQACANLASASGPDLDQAARSFLAIQQAIMLGAVARDIQSARLIYNDAIKADPTNVAVYLGAIEVELLSNDASLVKTLHLIFSKAASVATFTDKEKQALSARYVEIMDKYSPDIADLLKAQDDFYSNCGAVPFSSALVNASSLTGPASTARGVKRAAADPAGGAQKRTADDPVAAASAWSTADQWAQWQQQQQPQAAAHAPYQDPAAAATAWYGYYPAQ